MLFHLIGIKGTGMCALSKVLKDLGHQVTGSDELTSYFTDQILKSNNISIKPFSTKNITKDATFIASSAYLPNNNIEIKELIEQNIKFYYYHQFINEFFNIPIIGISGTHGKTTTTKILSTLMENEDVSYIIGDGTGLGNSNSKYLLLESCEYQDHFLSYDYDCLVINNIDYDHPDCFKNINDVVNSFKKASTKSKTLIVNGDDENIKTITHPNKITFGYSDNCDIRVIDTTPYQAGYNISILYQNILSKYYLPFKGQHMIYNFLSAISVVLVLNIKSDIQKSLNKLILPKRRMETIYYNNNIIINDYAHHPTEIKCLLQTINETYPDKQLIVVFQPHTYSRTLSLQNEFKNVFKSINLYLMDTFTSKREPFNIQKENQIKQIFNSKKYDINEIKHLLSYPNKLLLLIGAGNIDQEINKILTNS